ncbi:MAG: TerC/Alx family metal homeostasis membrane protein [Sciscionella sp.]
MAVPLWVWLATIAGFALLVALDVWQASRPHPVGMGEAARWSGVYLGSAVLFGLGVWVFAGTEPAVEFATGFLVEKTLSVDNLFLFALSLSAFAVPARHQSKVLLIGILGALGMRVVFIIAGAELVQRFSIVFLAFGALLIYTAIRLLRTHGQPPDLRNTRMMRWARRCLPIAEHTYPTKDGALLVRRGSRLTVTGLGLAVLALLSVDVMFALDSIPAIFGITQNLYLVLATNAFALLGLRALYFLLVGLLERLVHLHYGLAAVLGLIGVKLTLHYLHTLTPAVPEIPTWLSLTLIVAIFTVATATSVHATRHTPPAATAPDHPTSRNDSSR